MMLGWEGRPMTLWASSSMVQINLLALKPIIKTACSGRVTFMHLCCAQQLFAFLVVLWVFILLVLRYSSAWALVSQPCLPTWHGGTPASCFRSSWGMPVSFIRVTNVFCQLLNGLEMPYFIEFARYLGIFFLFFKLRFYSWLAQRSRVLRTSLMGSRTE